MLTGQLKELNRKKINKLTPGNKFPLKFRTRVPMTLLKDMLSPGVLKQP